MEEKTVFCEYLTEGCKTCPDWADGTNENGVGCACHFPIMQCPHFSKMINGEKNDAEKKS